MSFRIIRSDITEVNADAIVAQAQREPACGKESGGKIYTAVNSEKLLAAREKIGVIEPGKAAATRSFGLPAKFIIHTVVPAGEGGDRGEFETLRSCYRQSLKLALKLMCRSVAFELFPVDEPGYPRDKVLETALSSFREFLSEHEMEILLLVADPDTIVLPQAPDTEVETFLGRRYPGDPAEDPDLYGGGDADAGYPMEQDGAASSGGSSRKSGRRFSSARPDMARLPGGLKSGGRRERYDRREAENFYAPSMNYGASSVGSSSADARPGILPGKGRRPVPQKSLQQAMLNVGENFRDMLLRLIDERGLSDPYVYKKANLDRKLFSKIRCNPDYCPSKKTVIALAIALELNLDETIDLLSRAGFAFSPGSKADLIIEFCIVNEIFDIFEVDLLLFKYGQPTLG